MTQFGWQTEETSADLQSQQSYRWINTHEMKIGRETFHYMFIVQIQKLVLGKTGFGGNFPSTDEKITSQSETGKRDLSRNSKTKHVNTLLL